MQFTGFHHPGWVNTNLCFYIIKYKAKVVYKNCVFIVTTSTPLPEVLIMRVTTWLSSPEPKTVQPN